MEERSTGMSWIAVLFVIIVVVAIFGGNQIGDAALKKVKDAVQASAVGEEADDGKSA